jgi:serine/threonine protein kinase
MKLREAGDCLSVDEVLAFASGQLESERFEPVQAHLATCSTCLELVAGAVQDWEGRAWGTEPGLGLGGLTNFAPGDLVGERYRVERLLGCGGMGEVYAARDLWRGEVWGGEVIALKTLSLASRKCPEARQRLEDETRLARRVRHPNVCRVHAVELHTTPLGERLPFFTMAQIEGESLQQRLRRAPLRLVQIETLARQLSSGLSAIHAAGVMHLDLKSSNVMLEESAGPERAVIVDFGLSCARGTSRSRQSLSGTLAYMAPELLRGTEPSVQVDVFSFGVVLFEMLTQRLPFVRVPESFESGRMQIAAERPPAPSQLVPGVPRKLDEVVFHCLAEPGARYPDAIALARELAA